MPATVTFTKACHDYFGKLPGQDLIGFRNELQALTPKDRQDLIKYFAVIGIIVEG